jgi:hypothetical protein
MGCDRNGGGGRQLTMKKAARFGRVMVRYTSPRPTDVTRLLSLSFASYSKFTFFFFFICFWRTSGSFFMIFSSVAPHRGQPPAKCHPRWQPIRRLAVNCGLGRHWIRTQDCRTTVWCATIEPPCHHSKFTTLQLSKVYVVVQ